MSEACLNYTWRVQKRLGFFAAVVVVMLVSDAALAQVGCGGTPTRLTRTNLFVSSASGTASCMPPASCTAGQSVTFTIQPYGVQLDCCPHSFDWDFGDGTTTTTSALVVTHLYNTPGPYNVKVHVHGCGDEVQLDGTLLVLQQALLIGAPIPFLSDAALTLLALSLVAAGAFLVKR
jgi:PKD domain